MWAMPYAAKAGGGTKLTCIGVTVRRSSQTWSGAPAGDRWVGQLGPRGRREEGEGSDKCFVDLLAAPLL